MRKSLILFLCMVAALSASCTRQKVSELISIKSDKNSSVIYVSFPLSADSVFGTDISSAKNLLDFYLADICFRSQNDTNLIVDTIKVEGIENMGNNIYKAKTRIIAHHATKEQNLNYHFEKKFSYDADSKIIKDLSKPVHHISNLQMKTGKGDLVTVDVRFSSDTIVDEIFGTDSIAFEGMVALFFSELKDECRYEVTFVPRWIQSLEINSIGVDEYDNEIFTARALCGGYAKNGFGVESEVSDFIRIKFSYWKLTGYCDGYIMMKEELDRLLGR